MNRLFFEGMDLLVNRIPHPNRSDVRPGAETTHEPLKYARPSLHVVQEGSAALSRLCMLETLLFRVPGYRTGDASTSMVRVANELPRRRI